MPTKPKTYSWKETADTLKANRKKVKSKKLDLGGKLDAIQALLKKEK